MKVKAADAILARLREFNRPVPVHDLRIAGVSDNAAATRLSELARAGLVVGVPTPGARYKSWMIQPQDMRLPL